MLGAGCQSRLRWLGSVNQHLSQRIGALIFGN